ncbi:MAG: fimbrial protein [Hafnia sp.]|uniref:fimbrial protein n=1 Tax=Hafnia TaxID=568 RepID=UPI0027B9D495|nr:fimbrial protein [Hafnia paralvei]MDX6842943.1 fimbrial protein [Hafnia paralvei]
MKNRLWKSTSGLFLLAALSSTASAVGDQTAVMVTANVVASPCVVLSPNLTIPLGNIEASTLESANVYTAWSEMTSTATIKLANCPAGTTEVLMTFTGPPDPNGGVGSFLNMDTGTGAATNVSVQLKPSGSTDPIRNNEVMDIPIETGAALIPLSARLYTKSGGVTPGRVSSVINVAFSYK